MRAAAGLIVPSTSLALTVRRKPYAFTKLAIGISLGYRRNKVSGTWVVRGTDGKGHVWTSAIGIADDFEAADGERILDFWQASDKARATARGDSGDANRPATWAAALDAYEAELKIREREAANAVRVRNRLTPALLGKPIALLTPAELARWRDDPLASGLARGSVVRTLRAAKAS